MARLKVPSASKKSARTMGVLEMEGENADTFKDEGDRSSGTGSPNNLKRGAFLLVLMSAFAGFFVFAMNGVVLKSNGFASGAVEKTGFHSTAGSFGGINNIAHPAGAKAASKGEGIALADIVIPMSNVGHAIMSLNRPNIVNSIGHYLHDEHRSPYASHLYNATQEELEARQEKYIEKMKKVREEWGAWDFKDPMDKTRSIADFSNAPYKDLPREEFPPDAWQADEEYLAKFFEEGKSLVDRMLEGVYAEYGWGKKGKDEEFLKEREEKWKIHLYNKEQCAIKLQGCGMRERTGLMSVEDVGFDGLVRKLLHAMMTNDEFYAVLAGHSAAAGHGNDFQQNRIITFHHIMEPVFDKLGVRLVSRNMGMGGVGTLQFSLGGKDLYGETDIIEWDSGMTERGAPIDFFNKQMILSGERVPLLLTSQPVYLSDETNGTAWIGKYLDSEKDIFPETTVANMNTIPYAAQFFTEKERDFKYNAICWEPRSDFTPAKPQKKSPGSQVGWHPGNRKHTWQGRRLAFLTLNALRKAFEVWEEGIAKEGLPLAESYWHVGDSYKTIQETLRTHLNTPKTDGTDVGSLCDQMFPWMKRICRLQMHGFGMWLPRVHTQQDFLNLVRPAPNGYKPSIIPKKAYHGFDVLPLNQQLPENAVDVHAIAIATTSPPPDLDHTWMEDDNAGVQNTTEDTTTPTRRELRRASEMAFRKGAELFPQSDVAASPATENPALRRKLNDEIIPGRGWVIDGWTPVEGYCDGSAQSECNRGIDNDCLLAGANDKHLSVKGNSLSGWLVFDVPKVREGIILIRMEWWCDVTPNEITKDWTEVNNGMTDDTTPWNATAHREIMEIFPPQEVAQHPDDQDHRKLKPTPDQKIPRDLEMDYAVNGVIKTMKRDEWITYIREASKNVAVWPILNDPSMAQKDWEGEQMEVAIRFRSKTDPQRSYCISHVFYA